MAIRYYDDMIVKKLQRWLPEAAKIRVLKPDETAKLFALTAEDHNDRAMQLPLFALSRKPDIELLSTVKSQKSYSGLTIDQVANEQSNKQLTAQFNVIPIKPEYQLDIYTKTAEEAEEYIRALLFKLINNPAIIVEIPYNNLSIKHIANIRLLSTISDTSAITERIFSGQFTRWTIQFELHDAFMFSIPYRKNWILKEDPNDDDLGLATSTKAIDGKLILTDNVDHDSAEIEDLDFIFKQDD